MTSEKHEKKYVIHSKGQGQYLSVPLRLLRQTYLLGAGDVIYVSSSKNLSQLGDCDGNVIIDRQVISGKVKHDFPHTTSKKGTSYIFGRFAAMRAGLHRYCRS